MLVPCAFAVYVPEVTRRSFRLRFSAELAQFDCPDVLRKLAAELGVFVDDMQVHNVWAGSSWLEASTTVSDSLLFARLASGGLQNFVARDVIEGVDQSGNRVVSPTTVGGFPVWIIVVAVVCGLLLIAVLVVVVILVMRKRNREQNAHYSALRNDSFAPNDYSAERYEPVQAPAAGHAAPLAVPMGPMGSSFICATVLQSMTEVSDSVLRVQQGSIAFIEPADWAEGGEWVWCKVGVESGYVPRSYLQVRK